MEKGEKIYCEDVTRQCSLVDLKAWYFGESKELEKWLGFGFFNHFFVCKNGNATLYYDLDEGENYHKILKEKLTEELFDELCDYFFEIIEQSKNAKTNEEIFNLNVKSWPALTIFDSISKHPEFATASMIRRLIRVRQATESFSYELAEKLEQLEEPEEYIFYKGEIIEKPLNDFIKENNIKIEDE